MLIRLLAASLKDTTGLPWGCCIQPYAPLQKPKKIDGNANIVEEDPRVFVEDIARCASCFAYINAYAAFERKKWTCSLCGHRNTIETARYASENRSTLPELQHTVVEYIVNAQPGRYSLLHVVMHFIHTHTHT